MGTTEILIRERARRVYVLTGGYNIQGSLRAIGCHFDKERRQWWIGATRREALEDVIVQAGSTPRHVPEGVPFRGLDTKAIGSATLDGESWYVIWAGIKDGQQQMKLVNHEATVEKWVKQGDGEGLAKWKKEYQAPKTVRELQAYAAKMQNLHAGECPRHPLGLCGSSCPVCGGAPCPKAPLFLSINNFAKNMQARQSAKRLGLHSLGREWPSVQEVKGILPDGMPLLIEFPNVNFDIRHLSKNGKHGVRMFFSLNGGRIYLAREHENFTKDRLFFVHATPEGESLEVSKSWVQKVLKNAC